MIGVWVWHLFLRWPTVHAVTGVVVGVALEIAFSGLDYWELLVLRSYSTLEVTRGIKIGWSHAHVWKWVGTHWTSCPRSELGVINWARILDAPVIRVVVRQDDLSYSVSIRGIGHPCAIMRGEYWGKARLGEIIHLWRAHQTISCVMHYVKHRIPFSEYVLSIYHLLIIIRVANELALKERLLRIIHRLRFSLLLLILIEVKLRMMQVLIIRVWAARLSHSRVGVRAYHQVVRLGREVTVRVRCGDCRVERRQV